VIPFGPVVNLFGHNKNRRVGSQPGGTRVGSRFFSVVCFRGASHGRGMAGRAPGLCLGVHVTRCFGCLRSGPARPRRPRGPPRGRSFSVTREGSELYSPIVAGVHRVRHAGRPSGIVVVRSSRGEFVVFPQSRSSNSRSGGYAIALRALIIYYSSLRVAREPRAAFRPAGGGSRSWSVGFHNEVLSSKVRPFPGPNYLSNCGPCPPNGRRRCSFGGAWARAGRFTMWERFAAHGRLPVHWFHRQKLMILLFVLFFLASRDTMHRLRI